MTRNAVLVCVGDIISLGIMSLLFLGRDSDYFCSHLRERKDRANPLSRPEKNCDLCNWPYETRLEEHEEGNKKDKKGKRNKKAFLLSFALFVLFVSISDSIAQVEKLLRLRAGARLYRDWLRQK